MLLSFPASALIIFLLSHLKMAMDLQHFNTHVKVEKSKVIYIYTHIYIRMHNFPSDTEMLHMSTPRQLSRHKPPAHQVQSAHTASSKVDVFITGFCSRCCPHLSTFWLPEAPGQPPSTAHTKFWICSCLMFSWGHCNKAGPCVVFIRAASEYIALGWFCIAQYGQEKKATVPWTERLVTISAIAGPLF